MGVARTKAIMRHGPILLEMQAIAIRKNVACI